MKKILSCLALASGINFPLLAGQVYSDLPSQINPDDSYVFYSHGYIVEGTNPKPIDTRFGWGLYDFPAIKQALQDDSYHLIAYRRPKNTDAFTYAEKLAGQVKQLIKQGVDPENISIMGFSRGAFITGNSSNLLKEFGVNTIILAGCGRLVSPKHQDIQVYGHVLSIYEDTDRAHTCKKLKEKSPSLKSFTEIEINTGLEHGAFYRPIPQWVAPVKHWIKTKAFNRNE